MSGDDSWVPMTLPNGPQPTGVTSPIQGTTYCGGHHIRKTSGDTRKSHEGVEAGPDAGPGPGLVRVCALTVDTQAEGPSLKPGDDPKEVLTGGDPIPDASGQQAPDPVLPIDKPPDTNTNDAPEPGTSTFAPSRPWRPWRLICRPNPIVVEAMNKKPPPPNGEGIQPDSPIAANALGTATPPPPLERMGMDIKNNPCHTTAYAGH
ncbi:uncharacterized protein EI90DRAFT_3140760 [Cantharellus anzutake]|uniref:uncharacterized protein n=1 Tax=Cantharellus anzutake TaxID=1750568 RepID=UPI0019048861|nr:uncharacterized protein EI90DRAFT_3140760 [Cantharellus anzutake]KAF8309379.1 hypothetical protein EI90DRAFT_3140760 [Cantharellus anzutake]